MKIRERAAVAASMALVFGLAGCFEQKQTFTFHEDGSGTVKIYFKGPAEPPGSERPKPTQADADKELYTALARIEGIVAWTDAKAELKDGRVVFNATGWFEDASKVHQKTVQGSVDTPFPTFTKNADGTFTVELPKKKKEGPQPEKKEPLDEEQTPPFVFDILKELKIEFEVRLPGAVSKSDKIWKTDGRVAKLAIIGSDLEKAIRILDKEREEAKKDVEAKKITKEEANKKLKARQLELTPESAIDDQEKAPSVTCKGGEPADEVKAAKAALAEAKKNYTGSDLEKSVKAAVK